MSLCVAKDTLVLLFYTLEHWVLTPAAFVDPLRIENGVSVFLTFIEAG